MKSMLGEEYEKEGRRFIHLLSPQLAVGISPGYKTRFVSKEHPNEDAVLAATNGSVTYLALADAHWGKESSHIAIRHCRDQFRRWLERDDYSPESARELFYNIELAIFEHFIDRLQESTSETSLIVARIDHKKKQIEFLEFGDSLLIVFQGGQGHIISRDQRDWLGVQSYLAGSNPAGQALGAPALGGGLPQPFSQPVDLDERYHRVVYDLREGDYVLLCSDGVTEPIYNVGGLGPEELASLVEKHPEVPDLAKVIMDEALRQDREYAADDNRGGEDNISFALLQMR